MTGENGGEGLTFINTHRVLSTLALTSHSHFTDEQTEAQRDQETQLRSQLNRKGMWLGFQPPAFKPI